MLNYYCLEERRVWGWKGGLGGRNRCILNTCYGLSIMLGN